jgi:hypothetical protein
MAWRSLSHRGILVRQNPLLRAITAHLPLRVRVDAHELGLLLRDEPAAGAQG